MSSAESNSNPAMLYVLAAVAKSAFFISLSKDDKKLSYGLDKVYVMPHLRT